jgi:hypothetical protein
MEGTIKLKGSSLILNRQRLQFGAFLFFKNKGCYHLFLRYLDNLIIITVAGAEVDLAGRRNAQIPHSSIFT